MKNNRKNRRLLHIREKNRVRKGGYLFLKKKVTQSLVDNLEEVASEKDIMINQAKNDFNKEFNTNYDFELAHISYDLCDDDFINALVTLRVIAKKI